MVFKARFEGIVRGLPQGIEPTTTISAPPECYPYTEQVSYSYTQPDITEPGYWGVTVQIIQDMEAESGSRWGPFTLTITSPGCQGVSFVADYSEEFDIFLKKYPTVSQLSDGTNSYWIKDIDAREILEKIVSDMGGLKSWSGTLAQYNAITTKDSSTLYYITDD